MIRFVAIASLLAALAVSVPATANAGTLPGEQAMADPVALHELSMGVAWWQQHGITGCPNGVAAKVAPDTILDQHVSVTGDDEVDGLATVLAPHEGGCELWLARSVYDIYGTNRRFEELNRSCRAVADRFYCDDRRTVTNMREAQSERCSITRHELGHAIGGFDDDEVSPDDDITWVMTQNGLNPVFDDCEALAGVTWRYGPVHPRRSRHRGMMATRHAIG